MGWYYDDKLNEAVHRYHELHVCQSPQFEQAQFLYLHVLEEIRKYLSNGAAIHHHLEPIEDAVVSGNTGTAKDGFEFRVHFVMVSNVIADCFVIIDL